MPVSAAFVLGAGVAGVVDWLAHGDGAPSGRALDATVRNAVSRTALTASGLELSVGAGDGDVVSLGVGVGFELGDVDGDEDGCGLGPPVARVQLGDAGRVPEPNPDREPGRAGDAAGAPPVCPPGRGCPLPGCRFVLLGDTAVEASIAT
ncbi:MAG: hypothetical protein WBH47_17550 [Streptosporangiaceae bacterium]